MTVGAASKIQSAWRTALVAAAISLVVALLDPFGLDRASDARSADALNRMAAPFYPAKYGRDAIVTVPIDEAGLSAAGREWPPQYDFYGEVLTALTDDPIAQPAAIFLDFTYISELYSAERRDEFVRKVGELTHADAWTSDESCHRSPIAKLSCMLAHGGLPIIVGKPYPVDRCDLNLTVSMLERVAVLTPLGWPGMHQAWRPSISKARYNDERAPNAPPCPALDGVGRGAGYASFDYVRSGADAKPIRLTARGVPQYDLTPSAALFAALCMRDPKTSPHCSGFQDLLRRDAQLKIFWGSTPDPAYLDYEASLYADEADSARRRDCSKERATLSRALTVAMLEVGAGLNTGAAPTAVACPYHADIRYDELLDPSSAKTARADFIKGRAVLVGGAMAQSHDWISSITRGRAPGVVLHAMALDNLLELGPNMQRDPPGVLGETIDQGEIVETVMAFAAAFLIGYANASAPALTLADPVVHARARRRRLLFAALSILVALIVFVLVALALLKALHWAPVNILGLWLLTVAVAIAKFHDSLGEAVKAAGAELSSRIRALFRARPTPPSPEPSNEDSA